MDKIIRAAICQMQVGYDRQANLDRAARMIAAAAGKTDLLVLPEIFNAPYQTDLLAEYAEPIPGPTTAVLSELAAKYELLLVGGSIPECGERGHIYNTSCVFAPDGKMLGYHRKLHLFDIDIPGSIVFKESDVFTPGNELQTFKYDDIAFTVIICYDIRFPELTRQAALDGADIIIVPAAFNLTTGPAHWEILMRTRALDNQVFLLAASPARNPGATYQAWGHSMVVDPWGTVLAEGGTGEETIYAELDLEKLRQVRQELPLLRHRRPQLYDKISGKGAGA